MALPNATWAGEWAGHNWHDREVRLAELDVESKVRNRAARSMDTKGTSSYFRELVRKKGGGDLAYSQFKMPNVDKGLFEQQLVGLLGGAPGSGAETQNLQKRMDWARNKLRTMLKTNLIIAWTRFVSAEPTIGLRSIKEHSRNKLVSDFAIFLLAHPHEERFLREQKMRDVENRAQAARRSLFSRLSVSAWAGLGGGQEGFAALQALGQGAAQKGAPLAVKDADETATTGGYSTGSRFRNPRASVAAGGIRAAALASGGGVSKPVTPASRAVVASANFVKRHALHSTGATATTAAQSQFFEEHDIGSKFHAREELAAKNARINARNAAGRKVLKSKKGAAASAKAGAPTQPTTVTQESTAPSPTELSVSKFAPVEFLYLAYFREKLLLAAKGHGMWEKLKIQLELDEFRHVGETYEECALRFLRIENKVRAGMAEAMGESRIATLKEGHGLRAEKAVMSTSARASSGGEIGGLVGRPPGRADPKKGAPPKVKDWVKRCKPGSDGASWLQELKPLVAKKVEDDEVGSLEFILQGSNVFG